MLETTAIERHRTRRALLAATLFLALAVPTDAALLERSVIGSSGEVFRVVAGTYGELFPGAHQVDPSNFVLALDIDEGNGVELRLLVPGTESFEQDNNPTLVYDDASRSVHLVWETHSNYIHPVLRLASYGDGGWSEPIEISGNPFAAKTHPVVFVTHDTTYVGDAVAGAPPTTRTILHLVWAQEDTFGTFETLYSPILLGDGRSIAGPPVISLDDLAGLPASDGAIIDASTESLTHLRAGEDGRTVVIGFPSARTGRIAAVKLDVIPVELARLGEEARAHIIVAGAKPGSDLRKIADEARAHIIVAGVQLGFHEEVVRSIADAARAHIIVAGAGTGGDLGKLADSTGDQVIDAGVKFSDRGLRRINGGEPTTRLLEIPPYSGAERQHMVRAGVAGSLPAPDGVGPSPRLFTSASGFDFIISWRDGEHIAYRESRDNGGWSDLRRIRLSSALSADDAYAALERRVSSLLPGPRRPPQPNQIPS